MKRRIHGQQIAFGFVVRGPAGATARFLLGPSPPQAGLKLDRIAPQGRRFTAVVSGAGGAKLCQLPERAWWQVIQMQRRGPGSISRAIVLRRPRHSGGHRPVYLCCCTGWAAFMWCMYLEPFNRSPTGKPSASLLAQKRHLGGPCRPSQAGAGPASQTKLLWKPAVFLAGSALNFTGGLASARRG